MIRPGPLSVDAAQEASQFLRQTDANRDDVARRLKDYPDRPWAKITAYDEPTAAYSWTEQTFDALGRRIDKAGGLSGTKNYMPAYAFGDGSKLLGFPTEVQIRRTILTATKGPAYEFPLYCGCARFSGIGAQSTAGGTVLTNCCPGVLIPATLYAHVTVYGPSMNLLLTTTFPIVWNHPLCVMGAWWGYSDPLTLCQFAGIIPRLNAALMCYNRGTPIFPEYQFAASINCYFNIPNGCGIVSFNNVVSWQCSPFSVVAYQRWNVVNCHPGTPGPCTFVDLTINTVP